MTVNYLRYAGVYFAVMLGIAILSTLLANLAGLRFPAGGASISPPMIAALFEGQQLGRRGERDPSLSEGWGAASRMTMVAIAVNLALLTLFLVRPETRALILQIPAQFAMSIASLLIIAIFVLNRFFLTIGIKSGRRGASK